jgi:2-keto-4-pentenoate hydratase/2-oxohepta-3-ene-1,7-dioic acid hydratase in catechol pathway
LRFVTYRTAVSEPYRAGIVVGEQFVDAANIADAIVGANGVDWTSVKSIITNASPSQVEALGQASAEQAAEHGTPLAQTTLGPPIPDPNKVLCIGLNYRDHVDEAQRENAELGKTADPVVFSKFNTALIGDQDTIIIPAAAPAMVDWEGELAVVIGKRASRVSGPQALEAVAGYTIFNDVSARDVQLASPQWLMGKSFDTSGPCGPVLVTAGELGDPHDLTLETRVNDQVVQSTTTALMIHSIERLIEYISSLITLEPGDIIATGTPSGVGFSRDPQMFLKAGDTVSVTISKLGTLSNPVQAEK